MDIVFSRKCLEYSYSRHVENPERLIEAVRILKDHGYTFIDPKPASVKDLLRVHTKDWIERVKRGGYFDRDTPGAKDIYSYAILSAGGAIMAAKRKGFSMLRPPGHHAGIQGLALGAPTLGFCYFNNIAIAVRYLDRPTLILDIDGHHGNGTQDIFFEDPNVTYVSLHKDFIFPGTGTRSQKNILNFQLPSSTGNNLYLKTLEDALSQVQMKKIEVVGISAGFDAHQGDIASLGLTSQSYKEIGKKIRDLEKEIFGVLEGGYSGKQIASSLNQLIKGLEK